MKEAITRVEKAHAQADHIFHELLPANGLRVRPAQIKLCHEMLDAIFSGQIALCDAGVGIGKTYAYLVAGLLWQKYQPGGLTHTLTISTSSVALQNAILKEYIPMLSQLFVRERLLARPIRAVLRKGRERYVCDQRLVLRQLAVKDSERVGVSRKAALLALDKEIDLDAVTGLSSYDRTQVCVPAGCPHGCAEQQHCRYQNYLKNARSVEVDIQICNHNYLLADAIRRRQAERPLLRDYHILIVDEAHKLPEVARQMYGESISSGEVIELCTLLQKEHLAWTARRLRAAWQALTDRLQPDAGQEESEQKFIPTPECKKVLAAAVSLLRKAARPAGELKHGTIYRLERAAEVLSLFRDQDERYILYAHCAPGREITLLAASRTDSAQLSRDLWTTRKAAVLTSGTLAAGGSFARARQRLGLVQTARCREFSACSPFDYEHNCMLYIPSGRPVKSVGGKDAGQTADHLRELLRAAHGHALVLFTSYIFMSEVCEKLRGTLPYPLFEARRGKLYVVEQFRKQPNAVLCAAGPCWEGIDFPGDMVSLLVVVQLPFPTPDPVSEFERGQYPSLQDYIHSSVVPEMQTKLRQGAGRAIRTETDTCVIAILDKRAAPGARYHNEARMALPPCPLTSSIAEVERFIRARKGPDYYRSEEKAG